MEFSRVRNTDEYFHSSREDMEGYRLSITNCKK
jgi:hypothetical protein